MKTTAVFSTLFFNLLILSVIDFSYPGLSADRVFVAEMILLSLLANVLAAFVCLDLDLVAHSIAGYAFASCLSTGLVSFIGFGLMGKAWGCDLKVCGLAICGFAAGLAASLLYWLLYRGVMLVYWLVRRII